ncbi:MAG: hypothetical protein WC149_05665 [Arcobacteraceae bacterium]
MIKKENTQSETYRLPDSVYDIVLQVANEIRTNHNYTTGAKIAMENNISLSQIISKTLKLDIFDIAKLADAMKKLKTN